MSKKRSYLQIGLGVALISVVVVEQGRHPHHFDKFDTRRQIALLQEAIAKNSSNQTCRSFYYSSWKGSLAPWKYQIDAMWASLTSGLPTINGYSGNVPAQWTLDDNRIRSTKDIERISDNLQRWSASNSLSLQSTCWLRQYPGIDGSVFEARPIATIPADTP